jgi:preprotein translocase subunit YajC
MHVLALLAADDNNGSGAAGLVQIGVLLLIPLAMYFLMIRPQRRRMRDQQAMQSALEVGDEVMTSAGIYGFITGFEDDVVWVEIDDDVQIRVNRGSLQGRVQTGTTSSGPAPTAGKVTPTVKGLKPGRTSDTAEADAADTNTPKE